MSGYVRIWTPNDNFVITLQIKAHHSSLTFFSCYDSQYNPEEGSESKLDLRPNLTIWQDAHLTIVCIKMW